EVEETVYEQYTPKLKRYIKLSPQYTSEENLRELLDSLNRAHKQREVLMHLFMLNTQTKKPISYVMLQKKSEASAATLKALISKGILEEYFIQQDRIEFLGEASSEIKTLNEAQAVAYQEIKTSFETNDVVLLHGVTSSGKTEIYVRLIEEVIATGKQVLYMLPEIALTTQLISRLQKYFGKRISVYHSKFTVNERVEVWNNVLAEKPKAQV